MRERRWVREEGEWMGKKGGLREEGSGWGRRGG